MKFDLHCHSFYSKDALSSPKKLLKAAKERGLDGIAITDHDTVAGWEEAKKSAKELGLFLILGEEIKTKRNGKIVGDVLGLFLEKEIKSRDILTVIKEIKSQGGIVIVPHPFFFPENFKDNLEKYINLIDGIEVLNARCPFQRANKKAQEFAKKHNLAQIGSSDAHWAGNVGDAFTIAEAKNLEEFKRKILEKKITFGGKRSPLWTLILPSLARIRNIFSPPF
ncbi:PHP domain-containing protein [Candidatus Parcubacteria bacterium]|nr:PHP domain-containing protein [Candidatus Parcubacteria bacterium]